MPVVSTYAITPVCVATYSIDGDTIYFSESGETLLTEAGTVLLIE